MNMMKSAEESVQVEENILNLIGFCVWRNETQVMYRTMGLV